MPQREKLERRRSRQHLYARWRSLVFNHALEERVRAQAAPRPPTPPTAGTAASPTANVGRKRREGRLSGPVVVLSDRAKEDMDADVADELKSMSPKAGLTVPTI